MGPPTHANAPVQPMLVEIDSLADVREIELRLDSGGGTGPDHHSVSTVPFVLPTGMVTFLLTDIEGSTRLWHDHGDIAGPIVARHYELLDAVIGRWGGVRPVEQGEGDSIVAAFARASDAIAAALEAQHALAAEPWPGGLDVRVRMAVHTGEAQVRADADGVVGNYVGQTIIRCARIRSTGHGGQVLISDATTGVVRDALPAGASLIDGGSHRLKDLSRPERIWLLAHSDLASVDAPL